PYAAPGRLPCCRRTSSLVARRRRGPPCLASNEVLPSRPRPCSTSQRRAATSSSSSLGVLGSPSPRTRATVSRERHARRPRSPPPRGPDRRGTTPAERAAASAVLRRGAPPLGRGQPPALVVAPADPTSARRTRGASVPGQPAARGAGTGCARAGARRRPLGHVRPPRRGRGR